MEEEEGASLEGGLIQRQEGGARTIILTAGVLEQLRGRAREEQGRVGEYTLITDILHIERSSSDLLTSSPSCRSPL